MPRKRVIPAEQNPQELPEQEITVPVEQIPEEPALLSPVEDASEETETVSDVLALQQEESVLDEPLPPSAEIETMELQDTAEEPGPGSRNEPAGQGSAPLFPAAEDAPLQPSADEMPDDKVSASAQTVPVKRARSASAQARGDFLHLDVRSLDRELSPRQKKEWNDIYTSFRAKTPLTGTITGKEEIRLAVTNNETGEKEYRGILCFTAISYRVKILIPETELWPTGKKLARHVSSHIIGANTQYVITNVDRAGECAIASRRLAMEAKRRAFAHARSGNREGDLTVCNVLVVGPKQLLVECGGYDIVLRPADISYASILDLRDEYHSGETLDALIKKYDPEEEELQLSVKEVNPNPFDGADFRHPVGSDRQAIVTNRYKGGVFCRLADGVTCMCLFSRSYSEYDCSPGDRVMVHITRYDYDRKQIYGRIVARW